MRLWHPISHAAIALLLTSTLIANTVVWHKFELWGLGTTKTQRLFLYWGWVNGFTDLRGKAGVRLADCIGGLSYDQIITMIDKRYKEHPEWWSRPLSEQILNTLVETGAPCDGLNPIDPGGQ